MITTSCGLPVCNNLTLSNTPIVTPVRMAADSSSPNMVLRLVHPGGFVEVHKRPILAAKILEKNPRHCVMRPDVFRFPWFVVRPEAVLKPGNVFFIVPYHTIHCLMQRDRSNHLFLGWERSCQRSFWDDSQVPERLDNKGLRKGDFVGSFFEMMESYDRLHGGEYSCGSRGRAKIDCRHQDCKKSEEGLIFPKCLVDTNCKQSHLTCTDEPSVLESDFEFKAYLNNPLNYHEELKLWQIISNCQNQQEDEQGNQKTSVSKPQPESLPDNYSNNVREDERRLRSCLKKNKLGRSRSLRVKFEIPEESELSLRMQFLELKSTNSL